MRRVIEDYSTVYPNAIRAEKGEILSIQEKDNDPEWRGWHWCVKPNGEAGWISENYLKISGKHATLTRDYDARELAVKKDDFVKTFQEDHGWVWCENIEHRQGWVPARNLEASSVQIKEIVQSRSKVCDRILRALPQWFGIEEAIRNYAQDIESRPTFTAEIDGELAGFISLTLHNEFTAEIHVMGILEQHHRCGIGRMLIEYAEEYLRVRKYEFLTVKTLSSSHSDIHYAKTRAFYLALGFRPVEEMKTLWGPSNPCLFMIKSIQQLKGNS